MTPAPRFLRGRLGAWGSLALLPFPVLMLANDVEVTTEVAPNGAAYRKLTVAIVADRVTDVEDKIGKFFPVAEHWRHWSDERGGTRLMHADYRHGGVGNLPDGSARLTTSGGLLSLWTTYEFTDEVQVEGILPGEERLAAAKDFAYVLQMPGTIEETMPPAVSEGGRAEWRLKPSASPQTLTAKSRAFRLWYAVVLGWVVLFALGWGLPSLLRRRRPRPKRI